MSTIMLGVGDLGFSKISGGVIKTLALGSCVAVVLLHPGTRMVGMIHVALPESRIDPQKGHAKPGYFADTGIPALVDQMREAGCRGNDNSFIVKLAGGASVMDPNNTFNIGKRNLIAIKQILWSRGMGAVAEHVGGHISRSVDVDVDTGKVIITSVGRGKWDI
ncbi:MAG: chemotaxis protein CheD [Deltaproteobacteria bacterium]|nr:chemotaxis protein CheD [Deltaproteobacteria bacterium]